jgi:hypothetical protein
MYAGLLQIFSLSRDKFSKQTSPFPTKLRLCITLKFAKQYEMEKIWSARTLSQIAEY